MPFPRTAVYGRRRGKTSYSLAARLAIVPLVLEARGLDTTPAMMDRLRAQGDTEFCDILQIIFDDEITHVAAGVRWLRVLSERQGRAAQDVFQENVRRYHAGDLKPPFNVSARTQAGLPESWYTFLPSALSVGPSALPVG